MVGSVGEGETVGWPTELLLKPRSRALSWLTPKSTSTVNCWISMKGPVLLTQSSGISVTQCGNVITGRIPGEEPIIDDVPEVRDDVPEVRDLGPDQ